MLHTTRAFVIKTIKHGDRTVVLKVFTELFGMRSYMVRVGGKTGVAAAALQPLNRVEMVVDEHPEREIQHMREMRVDRPYANVPYDAVRGTLAIFAQEVLYNVLRGEANDPDLYNFLEDALEALDTVPDMRNYPVLFLIKLSGELGFRPSPPAPGEDRFDLKEGEFIRGAAAHGHTLGVVLSDHLAHLLTEEFDATIPRRMPASERRDLLDHLLLYYRMHLEGLGELRSPAVLHQVFN